MKLNKRDTIIMVVSLLIIIGTMVFYGLRKEEPNESGNFTLVIADIDENIVFDDVLSFSGNETLYDVIARNFKITCANKNYEKDENCSYTFPLLNSKVILGIKVGNISLDTDFKTSFLAIEVLEEEGYRLATKGFSNYNLTDGESIRIIVTRI